MSNGQIKRCDRIKGLTALVILGVFSVSIPSWSVEEITSKEGKERTLPAGFVRNEDTGFHTSGWPLEIRCLKDDSVMVFVPGGEFDSGLTNKQIKELAKLMSEYDPSFSEDDPPFVEEGEYMTPEERLKQLKEELQKLKPGKMLSVEDLREVEKLTLEQQLAISDVSVIEEQGGQISPEGLDRWRADDKSLATLWKIMLEEDVLLAIMPEKEAMEFRWAISKISIEKFAKSIVEGFTKPIEPTKPTKSWLEQTIEDLTGEVRPHKRMKLGPFYIDKYEVTNHQYRQFIVDVNDDKHRPGITEYFYEAKIWHYDPWKGKKRSKDNQPVTCISAKSAAAYAKWAGKSLPNSLQWERAAIGDGGRLFPWGSDFKSDYCRCNCQLASEAETEEEQMEESLKKKGSLYKVLTARKMAQDFRKRMWPFPAAVGKYAHDVSPFGCYDMAGNVSEWVQDGDKYGLMGGNIFWHLPNYLAPGVHMISQHKSRFQGFRTMMTLNEGAVIPKDINDE